MDVITNKKKGLCSFSPCCVQVFGESNNEIRKLLDLNVVRAYKDTPKPLLQNFPILFWEANAV